MSVYGLGLPEGWWDHRPVKLDEIDLLWDPCPIYGNIYDLHYPVLFSKDGKWVAEEGRPFRARIPYQKNCPTEAQLIKGVAVYEERYGCRPSWIIVSGKDQFGIYLSGSVRPADHVWSECEWCGSTKRHHSHCHPTEVVELLGGGAFYKVWITEAERSFLAEALESDRPEVQSLRRKLLL